MQKHKSKKAKAKTRKAKQTAEPANQTYWQTFYQIHLLNRASGTRRQTKAHGFFAIDASVLPTETLAEIVKRIQNEAKKCKSPHFDRIEVWSVKQMSFAKWEKKRKAMEEPRKPLAVVTAEQLEAFNVEDVRTVEHWGTGALRAVPACEHGIKLDGAVECQKCKLQTEVPKEGALYERTPYFCPACKLPAAGCECNKSNS